MKKIISVIVVFILVSAGFSLCVAKASDYQGKKILFINSYHEGYFWSDGETYGLRQALEGSGVDLKIICMDTKDNTSEKFKKQAALKVKKYIEEFKPDVVISADDNAFKYVIMPYYRDSDLPVVFCGINWDITVYGAPYGNTTGMIERSLIDKIYKHLKKFAKGPRVGFLGADVLSERKTAAFFVGYIEGGFVYQEFASDFKTWKEKYLEAQDKVDMLILSGSAGIKDWDLKEAEEFVLAEMKVPAGTEAETIMFASLLGIEKDPAEHGAYAARIALRILDGEKPSDIESVINKKGDLVLNLKVAAKLDVVFTPAMLRNATEIIGLEDIP